MKRFSKFIQETVELDEAFKIGDKVTYQKSKKERGNAVISSVSTAKKNHFYLKTEKEGTIMVPGGELELQESLELDEVSDKKLDAYRQKAFADQPAGDDGSDKYRKRKFGRDLAFAKQTGRAKVLATKEEIELEEKAYVSSLSPELGRKGSHDVIGKDGKVVKSYPYTKQGMSLAQKHLKKMKEEVELDEQTQYDLVESYLLENNIDVDSLTEEELNELIGKAIGGAFKLGAKAVSGAARRMSTAGKADAAEKKAATAEKKNKDRERIRKAQERLRAARTAAST